MRAAFASVELLAENTLFAEIQNTPLALYIGLYSPEQTTSRTVIAFYL
jgi:hypothetical protein